MKKRAFIYLASTMAFLFLSSCMNKPDNPNESNEPNLTEGNWEGCVVGMYPENGNVTIPNGEIREVNDFETLTQQQVGSVVWFPTWDDEFPTEACRMLAERDIIPHLTWELFWPSVDPNNSRQTGAEGYQGFNDVLNGKYDEYIDRFARDAKAFDRDLLIRFLHEFNGNWYVWSGNKNGKAEGGPQKVVAVWRYVVDRFKAQGADNVKWLWVPHGPSTDRSTDDWNEVANYWPGGEYVDWIGLDGYNFYPQDPWGGKTPVPGF